MSEASQIRKLSRQTLIYGTGNVLTRLVTFLLLPLFTHILSPEEYGVVTLIYVFLGFMNIIYHYGLDAAFMRHYSDATDDQEKKRIFSTAVWLMLVLSGILSLVILLFTRPLALTLLGDLEYNNIFTMAAGILFLDAFAHVPFAFLRMREKAALFVFIKIINVVSTLGLNIYFVAVLRYGITGIFISVLLASVVTTVSVFAATLVSLRPTFSPGLARAYIRFGLPFVPAGLASITMEMIDRYILAGLKDTATVGIYSAGYKLGIFMLLLTTAFNYAWQPFFLKMGKKNESGPVFARVFSYFILASSVVWVLLSAFIHQIVRVSFFGYSIIGPSFYEAEAIVPLILLAYMFEGAYLNFLPGIYFEKKTFYIPIITASGAAVNIVCNFILIPTYGMMGAAVATVVGYITMSVMTFFISRRLFPVPYEFNRLIRMALCIAVAFVVIYLFDQSLLFSLAGIATFVVGILALRVVSLEEIRKMVFLFRRDYTSSQSET